MILSNQPYYEIFLYGHGFFKNKNKDQMALQIQLFLKAILADYDLDPIFVKSKRRKAYINYSYAPFYKKLTRSPEDDDEFNLNSY